MLEIVGLHVEPPDHTCDEIVLLREIEQIDRFALGLRGLDDDRTRDAGPGQVRQQVGRLKVAIERLKVRTKPVVISTIDSPEMLVCIEHDVQVSPRRLQTYHPFLEDDVAV
ncbi:hypothetical protein OKW50_005730 [Paraburkholderia youngii]